MSVSVSVTARRVAAAALAATAVVGAVALPASAADRDHGRSYRTEVVISGVQHPSTRHDRFERPLNREWVELTNESRRGVNLDGWTLSDEDGHTYTFRHYRLGGEATVRVHTGFGRDNRNDLYQDRRHSVWGDDHDTATLRNDRGRFIDSISWGDGDRDRRGHRDGDRDRRGHRDGDRDHRDGGRRGGRH
ncbi:lamin tail domain-containing protein [Streptomyces dangxiongensis]|uniref:Lamin tail domain-containing protein n=1 Tax=Streptomyces dangxiongensis TaxID=1442032 RepID=A0A3G2JBH3_9ACTN|nr:lamin tail domain-containing protein [Streptomyces dangxiongensis]AYN39690.1 lamin tail domain-containing protein [Streptomyces dangxiongensis]